MGMFGAAESRQRTALARAKAWLNSPPLTMDNLTGTVVLVQFCTYTCATAGVCTPRRRGWP